VTAGIGGLARPIGLRQELAPIPAPGPNGWTVGGGRARIVGSWITAWRKVARKRSVVAPATPVVTAPVITAATVAAWIETFFDSSAPATPAFAMLAAAVLLAMATPALRAGGAGNQEAKAKGGQDGFGRCHCGSRFVLTQGWSLS
jgi:hypothetical protein